MTSNPIQIAHDMMPDILKHDVTIEIGVAILRSLSHSMSSIHTHDEFAALDGRDSSSEWKNLSETSLTQFSRIGFPTKAIQYLKPWTQRDSDSCGYHVIHFMHYVLFIAEKFNFSQYVQPEIADWSNVCSDMSKSLDKLCKRHFNYKCPPPMQVATGPELG